jgi:hypothetical protein
MEGFHLRGAGLEPARYCYHQPLKLACLPFHHPRIVRARSYREGLGAPAQQRKFGDYFVDPGVTAPAGLCPAGAGAAGFALFGACFDAGITLDAGADENGPPSKILPVTRRDDASARKIELAKKITANSHVALVSALPAPLAPNTVWLEPPNTAPTSAPLPCCSRIMTTIATQTIT